MAVQMNIAQAKARLSELVALAESGEEVVIARDGKPVVTLTPRNTAGARRPRTLGIWSKHGPLEDPVLFLRLDPELEALMEQPIEPPR